jgi:hypothetical protein
MIVAEYTACRYYRKTIAVYYPSLGSGAAAVTRKHKDGEGYICDGSGELIEWESVRATRSDNRQKGDSNG